MSTRILRENGRYYPQRRRWFLIIPYWDYFYYYTRDTGNDIYDTGKRNYVFNSLAEAESFMTDTATKVFTTVKETT